MTNKKSIFFTLAFIVVCLLVFYTLADFEGYPNNWGHAYGLWDKAKDILLLVGFEAGVKPQKLRKLIAPTFYLLLARFVWEIISWATGWNINSHWAISGLFAAACAVVAIYLIKKYRKYDGG